MEFKDFGNLVNSKLLHCLLEMKKQSQIKFGISKVRPLWACKLQNNKIVAVIWVSSLFNSKCCNQSAALCGASDL